jgi:hypothetical protein
MFIPCGIDAFALHLRAYTTLASWVGSFPLSRPWSMFIIIVIQKIADQTIKREEQYQDDKRGRSAGEPSSS